MHTRPALSIASRAGPLPLAFAAAAALAMPLHAPGAFLPSTPGAEPPAATEPVVPGSPAINSAWRSWREALQARAAFTDPRELAAKAEEYRSWLVLLDSRLTRPSVPDARPDTWQAALAAEGMAQREAALRRVLARVAPSAPLLDDPALQADIEAVERSLKAWSSRANLLAGDLVTIEHGLAEARTLDEGGPASIRALAEKWLREGLTRQPGVRAAVAPVLDRVEALEKIERQTSTEQLLQAAKDAAATRPELLFAAWRRLAGRGQAVWPAGEADLAAEVLLRPILLRAAEGAPGPDRAESLKNEVAMEQARRLTRLLSAAVDDATLAAADSAMRNLDLSEAVLDNRIRYNILLNRLKRAASDPGVSDEHARALAREFVANARNLQGGIAFLSGASSVVAALDAVAGGLVLSPATVESGRFGPASVGLGDGVEHGATLTFSLPPRSGVPGANLEFILVGEGASASYITVTEVTVGQVAAIVAARNAERLLPTVLPTFRPLDDSRLGPRTWTWSRDAFDVPQIVPSPSWFSPVALLGGVDYPAGQSPAPPSFDSPMQQIPAPAAAYVASLAGCRIPTTGEWSALLKEQGSTVVPQLANLRDARWKAFADHMAARKAAGRWAEPPDAGIFRPDGAPAVPSTATHPWDDGWVWFAPAVLTENETTSHVIGNVAEFTTTVPWTIPSEPREAAAFVAKSVAQLRIIGGSALSDPSFDPLKAEPLDPIDALEGFSDVGFRLAFGANAPDRPREQVGRQVVEILTPSPYLKPR